MALYRSIEALEVILRTVPKEETMLAALGYSNDDSLTGLTAVAVGLQRGNFTGDIWWDTPDGDSVFNHWRIAYMSHPPSDAYHPLSETAEILGSVFNFFNKIAIAGSRGSGSFGAGSKFFRVYEAGKRTKQRHPTSDQAKAITGIVRWIELNDDLTCSSISPEDEMEVEKTMEAIEKEIRVALGVDAGIASKSEVEKVAAQIASTVATIERGELQIDIPN